MFEKGDYVVFAAGGGWMVVMKTGLVDDDRVLCRLFNQITCSEEIISFPHIILRRVKCPPCTDF